MIAHWVRSHNEKFHDLYSPNILWLMKFEMGGACGKYGGEERCTQAFDAEIREKRKYGRHRRRWLSNINKNIQEIGWGSGSIWLGIGKDSGLL